jgi:transposase
MRHADAFDFKAKGVSMHDKLFETALGIRAPWAVGWVNFDESAKVLTVAIDFKPGSRFAVPDHEGLHPVHDTVLKRYRHLNFFQHECVLQVRTPRAKLPDGSVRLVEPKFAGRLSGFTLLFEALILMLAQQMPFAAVARLVGESVHRVMAVCERYVELARAAADFSQVKALAVDETSRARGHDYITLAADAAERRVLFVTEGRDAKTIEPPGGRSAGPRLRACADRVGEHRHVARVHQGLRRAPA